MERRTKMVLFYGHTSYRCLKQEPKWPVQRMAFKQESHSVRSTNEGGVAKPLNLHTFFAQTPSAAPFNTKKGQLEPNIMSKMCKRKQCASTMLTKEASKQVFGQFVNQCLPSQFTYTKAQFPHVCLNEMTQSCALKDYS